MQSRNMFQVGPKPVERYKAGVTKTLEWTVPVNLSNVGARPCSSCADSSMQHYRSRCSGCVSTASHLHLMTASFAVLQASLEMCRYPPLGATLSYKYIPTVRLLYFFLAVLGSKTGLQNGPFTRRHRADVSRGVMRTSLATVAGTPYQTGVFGLAPRDRPIPA